LSGLEKLKAHKNNSMGIGIGTLHFPTFPNPLFLNYIFFSENPQTLAAMNKLTLETLENQVTK